MLNNFTLYSLIIYRYNKAIKIKTNSRPNNGTGDYINIDYSLFFIFPLLFSCCRNRGHEPRFLHIRRAGSLFVTDLVRDRYAFGYRSVSLLPVNGSQDTTNYHKKSPLGKTGSKEVIFLILSYLRTAFLYLVLVLSIRMMGKRQIGQMEASEFVVTMLVANLASIPMQDGAIPLYSGLVPILVVLGMELSLSGAILRSVRVRRLFCGKPVILIDNGKVLQDNLGKTRVTLDELMSHLRQKDVLDVAQVQFAILETDGNLSVFPYPDHRPASARDAGISPNKQHMPITIIEDGYVSRENLEKAGKDERWLRRYLREKGSCQQDTFLMTVDDSDHIYWLGKEQADEA